MDETLLQKLEKFFIRNQEEVGKQLEEHPTYYIVNIHSIMDVSIEEFIEDKPEEVLPELRMAFDAVKPIGEDCPDEIQIYLKGFQKGALRPREINISHKDKLIVTRGIIGSVSGIEPLCAHTTYKCDCIECEEEIQVKHTLRKKIVKKCPILGCPGKMYPIGEEVINSKIFYMQDDPTMLGGSKVAVELRGVIKGDLAMVDYLASGDLITTSGILKVDAKDEKKAVYDKYLEVQDIVKEKTDIESIVLTKEDVDEIKALSEKSDVQEILVNSIAPSVYGHTNVKEGILLWLVSGVKKALRDGSKVRGNIHMLWVGDPSSAKSYMARWIQSLMPRVIYTQGKGTSVVGLTASLGKDEISGKWLIQAGAAVKANKGYLVADEIDKMKKDDLDSLDEFLESGTVTISKAISQTLQAECSCLAIANPKLGRFDIYKDIAEQVKVASPAFLSRFDLKYAILDRPDEETDEELVKHVLGEGQGAAGYPNTLSYTTLRKYLVYAKREIKPVHSKEAIELLSKAFLDLRKSVDTVPITVRQLQGLTRLAEASAKLRLSDTVEAVDSKRAIRVLSDSLASMGCLGDMGKADGKLSRSQLTKAETIKSIIQKLEESGDSERASEIDVKSEAFKEGISGEDVDKLLEKMKAMAAIYSPTYGYWKVC